MKKHVKKLHTKVIKKLPSRRHVREQFHHHKANILWLGLSAGIFLAGIIFVWIASLKTPDFTGFNDRVVASSTKIFDRTGEILLYDIHEDVKRSVVPFEDIALDVKNATVAIEDSEFYNHKGVRPKAFLRAMLANLKTGNFSQGGSTITQQVVKNALLVQDKRVSRKIKEWVLALKAEKELSKEEILTAYLNSNPYGGSIYGIQEASKTFFGIDAIDLSLAQSAYLAAIPNAPTYYSPYGKNKDKLDTRKDLVLSRMVELGFITQEDADIAKAEEVELLPRQTSGIIAPHFVFWVRDYLEEKYGENAVLRGGLTVKTTLDVDLQKKAEEIVAKHAETNNELYGASNAALVAIDPKTGQVLTMVGSKDYFDTEDIDGNFNVATAYRQPGSSFKPFVYATAMKEGYEPETVIFDTKTEFNPSCAADGSQTKSGSSDCYHPRNYDDKYLGPMNLRDALAQSRNVPAVKLLYLVGLGDSIKTAQSMGISSLNDPARYGLTLVLGGGEVQLLEMTSAYGVFANEGVRNEPTGILEVTRQDGTVLESYRNSGAQVLDRDVAIKINSILSDNVARTPLWGARSFMYHPGYDVAGKTGTTDNKVDAWMMGYSPDIAVGVWSGNNNNTPMRQGSGISGSLWGEFMSYALPRTERNTFTPLTEHPGQEVKPIIRGQWLGGESVAIDTVSGKLATEYTPQETLGEILLTNVHSILHWIDTRNPLGDYPNDPTHDNQYTNWEFGVLNWWGTHSNQYPQVTESSIPTQEDDIHTPATKPTSSITYPTQSLTLLYNQPIPFSVSFGSPINADFLKADFFIDNVYLGTTRSGLQSFTTTLDENIVSTGEHTIKAVVFDEYYNKTEIETSVIISE